MFDLSADQQAINEHLLRGAAPEPLIAARPGLRSPSGWDGFELPCARSLDQQVTVSAAIGLAAKLRTTFDDRRRVADSRISETRASGE